MEFRQYLNPSKKVIDRLPTSSDKLCNDLEISVEGIRFRGLDLEYGDGYKFSPLDGWLPDFHFSEEKMEELAKKEPTLCEFLMAATNVREISPEAKEGYKKFPSVDLWIEMTT